MLCYEIRCLSAKSRPSSIGTLFGLGTRLQKLDSTNSCLALRNYFHLFINTIFTMVLHRLHCLLFIVRLQRTLRNGYHEQLFWRQQHTYASLITHEIWRQFGESAYLYHHADQLEPWGIWMTSVCHQTDDVIKHSDLTDGLILLQWIMSTVWLFGVHVSMCTLTVHRITAANLFVITIQYMNTSTIPFVCDRVHMSTLSDNT